ADGAQEHMDAPDRPDAPDGDALDADASVDADVAEGDAGEASCPSFFVRGMHGADTPGARWDTFQSLGFDAVNVGPYAADLDNLASRGMRGVVWLGDYDRSTCAFQMDDATVTTAVTPIAGHAAILAYYLAD